MATHAEPDDQQVVHNPGAGQEQTCDMPKNDKPSNQRRFEAPTDSFDNDDESILKTNQVNHSTICNINPTTINSNSRSTGFLSKSRFSQLSLKLISAVLFGACSFLITVINKIVLTTYAFPSPNILGVGQMVAIILILGTANQFNAVTIRTISIKNRKMWTLAIIYLGNLITGLGGTKHLPLPMYIALRRFSIALTAVGEFYLLHIQQTLIITLTIVAMIGGSFVAAASDLSFEARGYLLVMASNVFTAANVVYIKKTIDSREINKHEILFYNALFTILPLILISFFTNTYESLANYAYWKDTGLILSFLTSCLMGYLLMLSTVLCTDYNSPLTTTIVGTIKNILTTYVGMYIGGDYKYNTLNFIGLNISLVGSLVYSYLTFLSKPSQKQQQDVKS